MLPYFDTTEEDIKDGEKLAATHVYGMHGPLDNRMEYENEVEDVNSDEECALSSIGEHTDSHEEVNIDPGEEIHGETDEVDTELDMCPP